LNTLLVAGIRFIISILTAFYDCGVFNRLTPLN